MNEPSPAERNASVSTMAREASRAAKQTDKHLPGEEGVWVLIFGDMLLFAVFFATFLFYRSKDKALFDASQLTLNTDLGAINTLLLLTSSLFVVVGVRAARKDFYRIAPWAFAGALLCGAGFGINKVIEYSAKIAHGITPVTNNFYMYYFILTGLHMFHVLIGMGVLVFLIVQSRKPGITGRKFGYVEGGACFWHMVDLLWIVLFPLIYLVR